MDRLGRRGRGRGDATICVELLRRGPTWNDEDDLRRRPHRCVSRESTHLQWDARFEEVSRGRSHHETRKAEASSMLTDLSGPCVTLFCACTLLSVFWRFDTGYSSTVF